jgi:hypothetical protein
MAPAICPECHGARGRWLPTSSESAMVDYFRCGYCGHVWNTPKGQPDGKPVAVTASKSAPAN